MNLRRTTIWLAVALVLGGLLAACDQSSYEIGMLETHLPGRWEASYQTFTGTKENTVRADAGQTLVLDYQVRVDKGSLSIEIIRPEGGPLWSVSLAEDGEDRVEIAIGQRGPHTIAIEGDNAGGRFELAWSLE
jgi:hypothetical protein